jgi:hypothetical protein
VAAVPLPDGRTLVASGSNDEQCGCGTLPQQHPYADH